MDYSNELDLEVLYRCALDYSFAVRNDIRASDFETDLRGLFLAIKRRSISNGNCASKKSNLEFFFKSDIPINKVGFRAMSDKQLIIEFRGEVGTCWIQAAMQDADSSLTAGTPPSKVATKLIKEMSFLIARFSHSRKLTILQQTDIKP